MAKHVHTAGPWGLSSESPTIIKQDLTCIGLDHSAGVQIAAAHGNDRSGFFPSVAEGLANAKLIAAAPTLLEALIRLVSSIENDEIDDKWYIRNMDTVAAANDAITLATTQREEGEHE